MKNWGIVPAILRALIGAAFFLSVVPAAWAQSATNTTLNVSSNNVSTGTAVTLTASVASGGTPVTAGLVVFCNASATHCEDSAIFGSAWMTRSGTATIHKTFGLGTHNVQAVFKGTNSYAASTSATEAVTVTGSALPTTTTISASGAPGSTVLTATVTSSSAVSPTGSVSFLETTNGNYQLASVGLAAAVVTTGFNSTSGPASSSNQAIAVGDFNNDGKLDYVVASLKSPATATIMLGNGDGTFTAGATYSAGAYPEAAVVADFNGDGNLDIAFANSSGNGVTILLGNGDGTFTVAANPALGYASSITVGDFNGDGIPDLAVGNNDFNYEVTILLGNGDGTFTVGPSAVLPEWSVNPEGIVAADFNGDGKTDLAVTSSDSYSPASYVVTILLGNGNGTFTTGQSYNTGASDLSIAEGDFNGDGIPDLAIANYAGNSVTVLLGNGDGTFTPGTTVATIASPFAITAGDFNNDGKTDLVATNYSKSTVTILQGNGDGTFTAASKAPSTGASPDGIVAGDFNGDGLLDLVTANYKATTASVLLQTVTSTTTVTASGASISGTQTVIASYSGDGTYQGSTSAAIPITGTPVATPILSLAAGTYTAGQSLTISDTTAGAVIYYTNDGSTPTTSSTPYTIAITLNSSQTISAIAAVGSSISSVATASYTIGGAPQTIAVTTPAPANAAYNGQFTVVANASSGLAVAYTSSGPCTNVGATYTMTSGTGSCSVILNQGGNSNYNAAPQVTETVSATPASQTITVGTAAPASAVYNGQFTVAASASSGLAVAYTSSGSCTNSGAIYTMTSGSGTCSVIMNQAGNGNYGAAAQVTETTAATQAAQTISVTGVPVTSQAYGTTFPVGSTGSLGAGLITITASGACSINGTSVIITAGSGICSVTATIAADGNYSGATSTSTVGAIQATALVTINPSSLTQTYSGSPEPVSATTSPTGLTLTYSYTGINGTSYPQTSVPPTLPGSYAVVATVFDPNYIGQGSGTLTISQLNSALSFALQQGESATAPYGTTVYFELSMASTPQCPTGTVQLYVDGVATGSPVTLTGASCSIPVQLATATMTNGVHSIYAAYSGDQFYQSGDTSATPLSYTVTQDATTVTLAVPSSSASVGYPLTFTATVTPVTTDNAQPPVGNVEFFDGATQIGSAALSTASSPYTAAFTTSSLAAGSHNISATFVDSDGNFGGNSSAVSVEAVNLIVPTINWTPSPTEFAYGTPLGSTQLTATVTDPITGNPVNGTIAFNFASGTVLPAGQTNLILTFTPADTTTYSGNSAQLTITIDQVLVTVTAASPSVTYGGAVPIITPTFAGFANGEGSSVLTTQPTCGTAYTTMSAVGSSPSTSCSGAVAANYTFTYVNGSVTVTAANQSVSVTTTAPASAAYNGQFTVAANASSGLTVAYTSSGSCTNVGATYTMTSGTGSCSVIFNQAGNTNYNAAPQVTETVSASKASPTTAVTLTSGTTPSTYGTSLTFKATVTSGATGTVAFYNQASGATCSSLGASTQIGSTQTLSSGTASVATAILPVGSDTVLACYSGDTNYNSSSGTLAQTVNKANSTTSTPTSSANPSTYGTAVTFSATVTSTGGSIPSGETVTFYDGGTALGTGTTNSSGVATYSTTANQLAVGSNSITATYAGDASFATSTSSALTQTVNKANSTTGVTLTSGTTPSTYGTSLTFKATVTSGATGTVAFYNQASGATCSSLGASTQIGSTQTLSSGSASVATTTLPVGSDTVLACYSGDTNYNSSSGTLAQTVNKANSTTSTPTSSANPSTYGTAVTFSATVTSTGGSIPSGETVTFYDGGTALGTGTTNSSGVATYSTTANQLAVGSNSITAIYAGDASFATSTSTALTQTVNKANSTTGVTLTSGTTPSTYGTSLTFKATVTLGATGTVAFYNEASGATCSSLGASTQIGSTQTLSSGTASVATAILPVGSDTVLACYSGDTNYNSSSGTLAQTVNKANSTTSTPTSSANPSTYGTVVTFSATVTSTGGSIPSGETVTFYNGGTALGTGTTNSSGVATYSTTANQLAVGSNSITATYAGDANFATSTSSALAQTVNKANSTTSTPTSSANPSTYGTAVTLSATVTSTGGSIPSGETVTFYDGGIALGTGTTNSSGVATYSTTASQLAVGSNSITATYAGDANFATSTSSALTQTVNKANSATGVTLTSGTTPSTYGTSLTFKATVTSGATGTVAFYNEASGATCSSLGASTQIGSTQTLSSGSASVATAALPVGSDTVLACYSGDTNYNSSSGTLAQTVDQAPAITSASSTTFTVGTAGSFTATATGYPAPTFAETGALPSGVTLSSAGVLSGTPAAGSGGTYAITITASNGITPNATQSFTLTVDQAPAITSASSATFTAGTAGSFTVTASGTPAPTFTETGALPSGVTLSSAGVLSGTPAAGTGGTYAITITASNGVTPNAAQSFTLTVSEWASGPSPAYGASTASSTSLVWSQTVGSGSNLVLMVGVSLRTDTASGGAGAAAHVTGVTFGSQALTCLGAYNDNATGSCGTGGSGSPVFMRSEVWYLLNPIPSTGNVTVTTSAATVIAGGSNAYSDVNSVTLGGTNASNAGQTGNKLATLGPITTVVGDLVFDNVATARSAGNAPGYAITSGNTLLSDVVDTATGSFHINSGTSEDTTTSPTMTWTLSNNSPWAIVAAVLAPIKGTQATLTVTGMPGTAQAYGATFTVATSGGSGTGAVTFAATGACSVNANSGLVTMTSSTGTCSVTATEAADANYNSTTSAAATVSATTASQTITVTTAAPSSAAYNSQFTVAATASSGLTVTYTSSGGCTNSGATYTMTSPTTACSVIFNQTGNVDYAAATQVTETVTATAASQTITVTTAAPSSAAYNSQFAVGATATSGLTVTYTSSGGCTNSGATYTMTSPTTACSVIFNQAGNADYSAATQVPETVTATLASQTITVGTPAPASAAYNSQFTVAATATSGLTVAYTSSGGCTNSGATYTMTSPTTACSVIFNQAGNADYTAATQVTESVTATKANQTITVTTAAPANAAYNSTFPVAATASSTQTVAITVSGGCTINGGTVTMTSGSGTCTVNFNQAGNTNYNAATQVTETVAATPGPATKLVFTTQPGGGTGGTAWGTQPVVTLEDAIGDTVTGTPQNVTLAIQNNAGPGGVLSGTVMVAVNTTTGLATFSGLSINKAGTGYTLTATGSTVDTTAGTVVSSAFNITAGAVSASASTVVANPTNVRNNGTSTGTITVTLLDANNNPVSGKTVTLTANTGTHSTISAASGQSSASGVVTFTVGQDTHSETVTYTAKDTTDVPNVTIAQTAAVTYSATGALVASKL